MSCGSIPLCVPNLNGRELEYVSQALKTGWVSTAGPFVNEFECKVASYVNSGGAVSCQNGTSGLHTALLSLGVSRGDEVIVPTLTFIAAVNPVKYVGAEPVFMDCDDSLTLDVEKLNEFCSNECSLENGSLINKKTRRHIKALVVVHVFGNMADMEKIMETAKKYNLKVLEDATEALGTYYTEGTYKGRFAGTIGNAGVYSFNGNKIITTGGGGMIVSDEEAIINRARHLSTQAKSDELCFEHDEIGYNYRMTNIQAAIGIAQLEQIEDFISIKNTNHRTYKEKLEGIPGLSMLEFRSGIRSNRWFYSLMCDKKFPLNRDEIIAYLSTKGIQTRPVWGLIHDQKPYVGSQAYKIEKASHYLEHVVNVPCSTNLTEADVNYVADCLREALI